MFFKRKIKIVTHNGTFHPDDVFAVATLYLIFEKDYKIDLVRTRDGDLIKSADIVVDVGFVYDKDKNRFDHHHGGAGVHKENNIPLASFGLVWEKYGYILSDQNVEIFNKFKEKIVYFVDAIDNGIDINTGEILFNKYSICDAIYAFNNIWKDDPLMQDKNFDYVVSFAKNLIIKELKIIKDKVESLNILKDIYSKSDDKRLLIIDKQYKFDDFLDINPDILLVIYQDKYNKNWHIQCAKNIDSQYSSKILFPLNWAGKRDSELQSITGVKGSIFCHINRFLFVTKDRQSAVEIANMVLSL